MRKRTPGMTLIHSRGGLIALRGAAAAFAFPIYRNGVEKNGVGALHPAVEHVIGQRHSSHRPVLLLDQPGEWRHIPEHGHFDLHVLGDRRPRGAHGRHVDVQQRSACQHAFLARIDRHQMGHIRSGRNLSAERQSNGPGIDVERRIANFVRDGDRRVGEILDLIRHIQGGIGRDGVLRQLCIDADVAFPPERSARILEIDGGGAHRPPPAPPPPPPPPPPPRTPPPPPPPPPPPRPPPPRPRPPPPPPPPPPPRRRPRRPPPPTRQPPPPPRPPPPPSHPPRPRRLPRR